jgi:two-component system, NarL family, sensor kinase
MNGRALLVATTSICVAVAGFSSAAAVILAVRYHPTPRSVMIALLAVMFLSVPLVGAGIARSEPRNPVGWIVLASGCFLPLAAAAYLYARAAFQERADLPAASWAGWLDGWPWVPAVAVIPVVGLLLFPNGRLPSRRWRPVLVVGVAVLAAISVSLLFGATLLDFPDQANPTALPGRAGSIAGGLVTCVALIAPLSTASAWSVHVRRRTTLVRREALALRLVEPAAWLITASWWLTLVIAMVTEESLNALPAQALAVIVLAATAWVAIRRYRLFDTRLAISRVLAYGSLSVCVIAVYLVVAASVEVVASGVVSAPIAVLAAVLVALPLRDLLARGTNRLVYGYRDDPYGALVRLGQRLEDAAVPRMCCPQ